MLHQKKHLEIPINGCRGVVTLYVYPQSSNAKLFEDDAPYSDKVKYHLMEGCTYTYEFVCANEHIYQFCKQDEIIKFHSSDRHPSEGTITTGIYVGHLTLSINEIKTQGNYGKVHLEIRSTKADYESDYRQMLEDIAEYYTDLVLQQGSPATQQLKIDESCSSKTLYQRFSFVRSIIDSEVFSEAIHKIISNPVRKWTDANIQRNIVSVRRLSQKNIRKIASDHDRIPLSDNCHQNLPNYLTSVPRNIEVEYKRDTIDNQENQFVKFVLRTFSMFCSDLKDMRHASERLKYESNQTIEQLSTYLDNQFFRQISMPTHLNMNSPVLQRKEGYREMLQSWLLFDLAAKLNWTGGDDVYEAGKKNVAILYEYWLFFKLLELICEFFNIEPKDKAKLVKIDSDGINLDIIQGKAQMVHGQQKTFSRLLNVAFYYNRTFNKVPENDDPIHNAGSWTMSMRPDYTLSLWPGNISEAEAEAQNLITHIHFDAKYRLNRVILEDGKNVSEELYAEKKEQELGIYKRADLLKMHAYKDAIRRTSGAYILYPGTESRAIKRYHEIVPGLGAFSIRPGHWQDDSIALKQFLAEVKAHILDRTSKREKMSYYQYDIYKEKNSSMLMENIPEPVNENRDFLPDETTVIVAYYKSQDQLDWILKNNLYNMSAGDGNGSISLDNNIINARYILLHNGKRSQHLIRIVKKGPKVYSRAQLVKMGYPQYLKKGTDEVDIEKEEREANRIYLVFELFKNNSIEKELQGYTWDMKNIIWNHDMATCTFTENLVKLIKKTTTLK